MRPDAPQHLPSSAPLLTLCPSTWDNNHWTDWTGGFPRVKRVRGHWASPLASELILKQNLTDGCGIFRRIIVIFSASGTNIAVRHEHNERQTVEIKSHFKVKLKNLVKVEAKWGAATCEEMTAEKSPGKKWEEHDILPARRRLVIMWPQKWKKKNNNNSRTENDCSCVCLQNTIAQMTTITFTPDTSFAGNVNHRQRIQCACVAQMIKLDKEIWKKGKINSSPFTSLFFSGRVLLWFCCCCCCRCCGECCHLLHQIVSRLVEKRKNVWTQFWRVLLWLQIFGPLFFWVVERGKRFHPEQWTCVFHCCTAASPSLTDDFIALLTFACIAWD